MFETLTLSKDKKERIHMLRSMEPCSAAVALEALESNNWDSSMAIEWIKYQKEHENPQLAEFQAAYAEARKKSVELPADRYDAESNKDKNVPANRQARRGNKQKASRHKKSFFNN